MKKLVIIDGKSVFYRGYYAMGALSTSEGVPTGGVYGFAAISMELVKKLEPNKVVVAWDKAKTSTATRTAIFSEYKAGRVKPPEDFYAQIPYLRELILDLGWGFLEADEYEADDIIGTLAREAKESGEWKVYIISSDLDMLQVVDENVKMYRLLKGFSELEEIDVAAVEEKYGIKKEQFLDLKAIKGDASDNIPGVPGIGEKGAVRLLNEYESLDGVYQNIENIKGATRKKLEAGKESAEMSYELAKIMTDAPVKLEDVPELVIDKPRILGALEKLEFKSLERKFMKWSMGEFEERKAEAGVEKSVVDDRKLPEDVIFSFNVKKLMHENPKVAKRILEGAKFYDLGQGRFLLNPLERREETDPKDDAEEMRREYFRQQDEFLKYPKLKRVFLQLDMPMVPVLYKIEERGMKIDFKYFEGLAKEFERQIGKLTKEIY